MQRLLVLALAVALGGCGLAYRAAREGAQAVRAVGKPGRYGPLTEQERGWARTAWRYVERNTQWATGTVNGSDGYAMVSMWDAADALAAVIAARELDLITEKEFNDRLSNLLGFLNRMPLPHGLPNRRYDARSGQPVGDDDQPGEVGWSAVHLGRLLIWLRILQDRYPGYGEYAGKAVLRWDLCRAVGPDGTLYGGDAAGTPRQEGRLGMEEYVARGFQAWGVPTPAASAHAPADTLRLYGVTLPVDARGLRTTSERASVTTLPVVLDGMEFGWEATLDGAGGHGGVRTWPGYRAYATAVYDIQRRRYEQDRVLTARTDHLVSGRPYFVFDALWSEGYAWNTVAPSGAPMGWAALVATKAAFGLWALFPGAYTDALMELVEEQHDGERGWYEGRAEQSGAHEPALSLATNATVLEALLYKQAGRLYRPSPAPSYYERFLGSAYNALGRCTVHAPRVREGAQAAGAAPRVP